MDDTVCVFRNSLSSVLTKISAEAAHMLFLSSHSACTVARFRKKSILTLESTRITCHASWRREITFPLEFSPQLAQFGLVLQPEQGTKTLLDGFKFGLDAGPLEGGRKRSMNPTLDAEAVL